VPITFEEAARRLAKARTSVAGHGSELALRRAGVASKTVMNSGADHLSGYGRGRRRGRVDAKVGFEELSGLRIHVHPTRGTKGLWALLEGGSARAGSTWKTPRRRGQRRARGTVGTYQRSPVPARRTWTKVEPQATRAAFRAYHRSITREVFGVVKGAR